MGTSAESFPHPSTEVGRTGTLEIHERGVQTVGREDWGQGRSTTVMSELSSISQDTVVDGPIANCTIDSESSSLYVTRPQPSVPKQTHTDETTGGAARTDPQMGAAARLPPPPTHPLYVAQKMPPPIPAIPGSQGGESWKSGKAGVRETSPRRTLNANGEPNQITFTSIGSFSLCAYNMMGYEKRGQSTHFEFEEDVLPRWEHYCFTCN